MSANASSTRVRGAVALAIIALAATSLASAHSVHNAASTPIYRGNGGKTLPPIRVNVPSTLRWSAGGGIFQIFTGGNTNGGGVNSSASKGWTYVAPNRYTLQINAIGNWTVQIVKGVEPPQKLAGGLVGYKGNGGLDLPPLRLPRSEQVYWTNSGSIFQIFDSNFNGGINVNSQGHKGSTYGGGGRHVVVVNAIGTWQIAWRP
jgi:hypothetical protein